MSEAATIPTGSWRGLLGRQHGGAATVLAGGVSSDATNEFITDRRFVAGPDG